MLSHTPTHYLPAKSAIGAVTLTVHLQGMFLRIHFPAKISN